jgi:hypothetical protein
MDVMLMDDARRIALAAVEVKSAKAFRQALIMLGKEGGEPAMAQLAAIKLALKEKDYSLAESIGNRS